MPSLGLAMIVKNGAETLRECIASVAEMTDQIVIADTGSSDGTPQLARELGAEVLDFCWQDDFSQARNAAVKALTTDWVLVLDDDEELDTEARDKISALLHHTKVGGYRATVRNYMTMRFGVGGNAPAFMPMPTNSSTPRAERARSYADFNICRLFRRHPEIYYVGRVHETVEPRIRKSGLEIGTADFLIHHFGILGSPEARRLKDEFYRKLGWLKVKDDPNDAQAWAEIGLQEYEQFKNYSISIECFRKALGLDPEGSSVPYFALANLYIEIQADSRAIELLSSRTMTGRAAGEKEKICGDALYNLGRLKEARSAYMRALRILSGDPRILSKLGLTEVRLGLKRNGLVRLERALHAAPDVLEMHDRTIKAYLVLNRMQQAAKAAERLAEEFPSCATTLRAASIRAEMKEWKAAEDVVLQGLKLLPDNRELLQVKAEIEREAHCAYCSIGRSEEIALSRP